jgi:hypothetical protein
MKLEKVIRFARVNNGALTTQAVEGPRIVEISLPRVRFIEGSECANKYFHEGAMSAADIAKHTGVPLDKIESYLERKGSGRLTKQTKNVVVE